jgi:cytochrome c-type biogenesis protein CcmH/NrfG
MGKNPRNQEMPGVKSAPGRGIAPGIVVVIGAVCLAAGLGGGYYFGRQSTQPATVAQGPQNGAFAEDEARLRGALMSNPNDLESLIQLGNLCYDNGKFQDAVDWYGRALAIDPKNVNVRTDRGTSYWNLRQADAAIAEFRKSLELNPSHAQTLYNLGVVLLDGKNNAQEARKVWETLLATNPNYPERAKVQEQLASLSGGSTPQTQGQSKSVSPTMQEMLERMKTRR